MVDGLCENYVIFVLRLLFLYLVGRIGILIYVKFFFLWYVLYSFEFNSIFKI